MADAVGCAQRDVGTGLAIESDVASPALSVNPGSGPGQRRRRHVAASASQKNGNAKAANPAATNETRPRS